MTDETRPTDVHRVTLLVVDHDRLGAAALKTEIESVNFPNDCVSPKVVLVETRRVDWHDGHPLNQRDGWRAAYEALFPAPASATDPYRTAPAVGFAPDPVGDSPGPKSAAASGDVELANLRAVAGALYAKLLQTAQRLGKHENTAALELDLAKVHVELGKLGVV